MQSFNKFAANVAPLGQRIQKGFGNLGQQAREYAGQVDEADLTILPKDYLDLEARVDALKTAHAGLLKIAKVYDSEGYDYPTQVQESAGQLGSQVSHSVTSWAASVAKGTNLPPIKATDAPESFHRTLPHALSRASASGALQLGASATNIAGLPSTANAPTDTAQPSKLGEALQKFALAEDRLGNARLAQDREIQEGFLRPWQSFGNQINVAMKARAAVNSARLHLDSWKVTLKASETAGRADKLDAQRLEVEKAEDSLVAATEEAIAAMKAVTDNPEGVKALASFVKAQLDFHKNAQELLNQASQELSQVAFSSENEYRASRS